MHHISAMRAQPRHRARNFLRRFVRPRARHLNFRPRRIRQRPQKIERRPHLQLNPHRLHIARRAMKCGRKQEPDAHLPNRPRHHFRLDRGPHAQRFQNIRAAAPARNRPVAVLRHAHARARHHKRRDGRNIERRTSRCRPCRTYRAPADSCLRSEPRARHRASRARIRSVHPPSRLSCAGRSETRRSARESIRPASRARIASSASGSLSERPSTTACRNVRIGAGVMVS